MWWLVTPISNPVITITAELSIRIRWHTVRCCMVVVGGVTDVKLPDAPGHISSRP